METNEEHQERSKEAKQILNHLKRTFETGGAFFLMADLREEGEGRMMLCGSEPEKLTDFIIRAMKMDKRTEAIIMEASMQFLIEKLLADKCPTCNKRNDCDAAKASCVPVPASIEAISKLFENSNRRN